MSFDEYNRIHTTDMRLLRRMVRDSQFRSHDAETTLRTWADVREGEEKYIFPYQSSADIIFNTTLIYEFAVLKNMRSHCCVLYRSPQVWPILLRAVC